MRNNLIILLYLWAIVLIPLNNLKAINAQSELSRMAQDIRAIELDFTYLDNAKRFLEAKQKNNINNINKYAQELLNSVVVLFKFNKSPLPILLANDYSTQELAISYTLFNYYNYFLKQKIITIENEAKIIRENYKELKKIEKQLIDSSNKLKNNRDNLKKKLKTVYSNREIKNISINHDKLINKHNNIVQLIKPQTNIITKAEEKLDENFKAKQGKLSWISNGFIKQKFRDTETYVLTYNGVILLGLANSEIVSPADGKVIYKGYSTEYKNIIIIQHSPSYFSIISGDLDFYVNITEKVMQHEPIAFTKNKLTPIYFEIQENFISVDPLKWLEKKEEKIYNTVN